MCLPAFQVEKSRNPQGGNCSLKLSYLEILLNSWEEFLSPPAFFWENSHVSMEVWVMSLRSNAHSYPTEIWTCRCWKYQVLKSWSLKVLCIFFYNILKVFTLCQLHILILKERPWYLENTMCLFPLARYTMNSLCSGENDGAESVPSPQSFQAHNKHVYLFTFRSNRCTPLPAGEWVTVISFDCFPKRVNEVIKPSGRPSAVIYYIHLADLWVNWNNN